MPDKNSFNVLVESLPNPLIQWNEDLTVRYANPAASTFLKNLSDAGGGALVGRGLDLLGDWASAIEPIMADVSGLPRTAELQLGDEWIKMQIYPIHVDGVYQGPATLWEIISEQKLLESKGEETILGVAYIQVALDEIASGNVDYLIEEDVVEDMEMMRDNVNAIAKLLQRFRSEFSDLTESTRSGRLSDRVDVGKFLGAYAEIMTQANSMIDEITEPIQEIRTQLAEVAKGNLAAYVEGNYEGDHALLSDALNSTLDSLNKILSKVEESSNHVATGTNETLQAATSLAAGASEQAATLEQITASISEMASQTSLSADNSNTAQELAASARKDAEHGNEQMRDLLEAMAGIEVSSQSISKIIRVIDEIAFQTNLLALNAAVEAARAGVHGKGFAVVAEEVRNLASRSASAAKETTEMIEDSIKRVGQGTAIADTTAAALDRIVTGVSRVANLVSEIADTSSTQADGISHVNTGLAQLNQVTQSNAAAAEETAASSEDLARQASQLRTMLEQFSLKRSGIAAPKGALPAGVTPEIMAAFLASRS
jgi:methyl-accepting chemotaxis protein